MSDQCFYTGQPRDHIVSIAYRETFSLLRHYCHSTLMQYVPQTRDISLHAMNTRITVTVQCHGFFVTG